MGMSLHTFGSPALPPFVSPPGQFPSCPSDALSTYQITYAVHARRRDKHFAVTAAGLRPSDEYLVQ